MQWNQSTMYEQRVRFILEVQQGTFSFAESCRRSSFIIRHSSFHKPSVTVTRWLVGGRPDDFTLPIPLPDSIHDPRPPHPQHYPSLPTYVRHGARKELE